MCVCVYVCVCLCVKKGWQRGSESCGLKGGGSWREREVEGREQRGRGEPSTGERGGGGLEKGEIVGIQLGKGGGKGRVLKLGVQ